MTEGSNKNVRLAAARQIGSIQCAIDDSKYLISRVKNLLYNEEWDVRVAAGEAIDQIASNIDIFQPSKEKLVKEEEDEKMEEIQFESYSFEKYDLQKELENGNEMSKPIKMALPKKRAPAKRTPKKVVKEIPPKKQISISKSIDSIVLPPKKKLLPPLKMPEKKLNINKISKENNNLSTRLVAIKKRKERMEQQKKDKSQDKDFDFFDDEKFPLLKSSSNTENKKRKTDEMKITEQPQDNNTIVMESTCPVEENQKKSDEWPFHSFVVEFCNSLKSENWIKRHGGAIGLRALMKKHASAGGLKNGQSEEEQMLANQNFLENVCVRLFSVFALDRFGDYVSDKMIAPIRETCAQVLLYLLPLMNELQVRHVLKFSSFLVENKEWQVRLSGFTALKYLTISRKDCLVEKTTFEKFLASIFKGLKDNTDEVISAAAEILIPVIEEVTSTQSQETIKNLVEIMWNLISHLDDLSVSTVNIMKSLTELYSSSHCGEILFKVNKTVHPLTEKYPCIWKFFRHNIEPVREQVLVMTSKLLDISSPVQWLSPIFKETISFIYDNMLLEQNKQILDKNIKIWRKMVEKMSENPQSILEATFTNIDSWIGLLVTKAETPFNKIFFTSKKYPHLKKKKEDSDCVNNREKNNAKCQKTVSKALGYLVSHWPSVNRTQILQFLLVKMRDFNSVEEKISISMIFLEYFKTMKDQVFVKEIEQELWPIVESKGENLMWVTETFRFQQNLMLAFRNLHITLHENNAMPNDILISNNTQITIETMQQLSRYCTNKIANTPTEEHESNFIAQLFKNNNAFLDSVSELEKCQNKCKMNISSSYAQVLVFGEVSDKKAPILHCLKETVFSESNLIFQKRSAKAIAHLIKKHLDSFDQQIDVNLLFDCIFQNLCKKTKNMSDTATRGSKYILQYIPRLFGDSLLQKIPQISNRFDFSNQPDPSDSLKILNTITPHLTQNLKDYVVTLLESIIELIKTKTDENNLCISTVITTICENSISLSMVVLIEKLVPLGLSTNEFVRLGFIKVVEEVIKKLDLLIVPYIVYLVFPVLSRISDHNETVRKKAAYCFAKLVKLMPLEEGSNLPPNFPVYLVKQRIEKRQFLAQLLDGKKLDKFELPIPIKGAYLRSYQQEGLNWLAFLNKYNLHGILCGKNFFLFIFICYLF